ncbi:hypothetical protein IFR05_012940, partial [Cadophora sp. M221]
LKNLIKKKKQRHLKLLDEDLIKAKKRKVAKNNNIKEGLSIKKSFCKAMILLIKKWEKRIIAGGFEIAKEVSEEKLEAFAKFASNKENELEDDEDEDNEDDSDLEVVITNNEDESSDEDEGSLSGFINDTKEAEETEEEI